MSPLPPLAGDLFVHPSVCCLSVCLVFCFVDLASVLTVSDHIIAEIGTLSLRPYKTQHTPLPHHMLFPSPFSAAGKEIMTQPKNRPPAITDRKQGADVVAYDRERRKKPPSYTSLWRKSLSYAARVLRSPVLCWNVQGVCTLGG